MSDLSIPIIGLAVAVFVLILLVLRTKVHPLIAMITAACVAGITGGLSVNETLDAITEGLVPRWDRIGGDDGAYPGSIRCCRANRLFLYQVAGAPP